MADYDPDASFGIPDKRKNSRTSSTSTLGTPANYSSIGALKARLTAINAGYWTAARLNLYTENDLIYALRLADDAASV
jgi:hypothetical protein